jgi:anti-sigma-K factor RskA
VAVPQQPAQPLAATNVSAIARERFWRDQVVAESLMVPLSMVVGQELVEDADEAPFLVAGGGSAVAGSRERCLKLLPNPQLAARGASR